MERFGKVRWCKLVMDKTTGRHRGTAFVHYLHPAAAAAAIRAGGAFTGSSDWEKVACVCVCV
jgi:nucleolar protein 4